MILLCTHIGPAVWKMDGWMIKCHSVYGKILTVHYGYSLALMIMSTMVSDTTTNGCPL